MQEENVKKMNFFNRVLASIKDFDKYQIFALEETKRAIKYLVIIIMIFSLIIAMAFTYKFGKSFNNGIKYFQDNIKELAYSDGKLSVNSRRRNCNYK